MSCRQEALEAELRHQLDLVRCHRAERIVSVAWQSVGLAPVAISPGSQAITVKWSASLCTKMRLRAAMQQQERWAIAADPAMNPGVADIDHL
jgi:hypothetical protein